MSKGSYQTARLRWLKEIREGKIILCALCGEPIPRRATEHPKGRLSVDHIVPKSRGGHNGHDNYQPTHMWCNKEKGNMTSALNNLTKESKE